ncbi:MAG: hypothetical protein HDT14_08300 [Oscillibacter sp.]|nr:hypothetical protein [Oscillibacter sp.]
MKKRILLPITALLCLVLLAGCQTLVKKDFDVDTLSKAQKIVVTDAAGNEKAVLTEKADIDAFVDAINVGGWKFAELPEGLTKAGGFTLWQEETITALLGKQEAKANEICTFRIYEDGNYLTIETVLMDFPLSIPESAAAYLRSLAA